MTYYPDLTRYEYSSVDSDEELRARMASRMSREDARELRYWDALRTAVNVGWLDAEHDYAEGVTSREFQAALFRICAAKAPVMSLGYHPCDFCSPEPRRRTSESLDGVELRLGCYELALAGAIRSYAAPDLIYHYVTRHHYQPPAEFIEAVLAATESTDP
jgi:hypothetical protein